MENHHKLFITAASLVTAAVVPLIVMPSVANANAPARGHETPLRASPAGQIYRGPAAQKVRPTDHVPQTVHPMQRGYPRDVLTQQHEAPNNYKLPPGAKFMGRYDQGETSHELHMVNGKPENERGDDVPLNTEINHEGGWYKLQKGDTGYFMKPAEGTMYGNGHGVYRNDNNQLVDYAGHDLKPGSRISKVGQWYEYQETEGGHHRLAPIRDAFTNHEYIPGHEMRDTGPPSNYGPRVVHEGHGQHTVYDTDNKPTRVTELGNNKYGFDNHEDMKGHVQIQNNQAILTLENTGSLNLSSTTSAQAMIQVIATATGRSFPPIVSVVAPQLANSAYREMVIPTVQITPPPQGMSFCDVWRQIQDNHDQVVHFSYLNTNYRALYSDFMGGSLHLTLDQPDTKTNFGNMVCYADGSVGLVGYGKEFGGHEVTFRDGQVIYQTGSKAASDTDRKLAGLGLAAMEAATNAANGTVPNTVTAPLAERTTPRAKVIVTPTAPASGPSPVASVLPAPPLMANAPPAEIVDAIEAIKAELATQDGAVQKIATQKNGVVTVTHKGEIVEITDGTHRIVINPDNRIIASKLNTNDAVAFSIKGIVQPDNSLLLTHTQTQGISKDQDRELANVLSTDMSALGAAVGKPGKGPGYQFGAHQSITQVNSVHLSGLGFTGVIPELMELGAISAVGLGSKRSEKLRKLYRSVADKLADVRGRIQKNVVPIGNSLLHTTVTAAAYATETVQVIHRAHSPKVNDFIRTSGDKLANVGGRIQSNAVPLGNSLLGATVNAAVYVTDTAKNLHGTYSPKVNDLFRTGAGLFAEARIESRKRAISVGNSVRSAVVSFASDLLEEMAMQQNLASMPAQSVGRTTATIIPFPVSQTVARTQPVVAAAAVSVSASTMAPARTQAEVIPFPSRTQAAPTRTAVAANPIQINAARSVNAVAPEMSLTRRMFRAAARVITAVKKIVVKAYRLARDFLGITAPQPARNDIPRQAARSPGLQLTAA